MAEAASKRTRRTPEERAAEIDQKIQKHQEAVKALEKKKREILHPPKRKTDAQLSRMYRKGEDVGYTQQQIDDRIRQKYGQQDPHLLTRAQYDEICNSLDAARRQGQGGN